ncbi:MAG: hypothetical protein HWE20_02460 [Gammaproteobacteria bacterium]|nr:hypothetical protein [Gammaproteobacteria bacterium]
MRAKDFIDDDGERIPDEELSPSQLGRRLEAMHARAVEKQRRREEAKAQIARLQVQAMYNGIEKAAMKAGKKRIKQMADKQIKKALD